jgi:hypothetical protein
LFNPVRPVAHRYGQPSYATRPSFLLLHLVRPPSTGLEPVCDQPLFYSAQQSYIWYIVLLHFVYSVYHVRVTPNLPPRWGVVTYLAVTRVPFSSETNSTNFTSRYTDS